MNTTPDQAATFAALLESAINQPGKIHEAFRAFHAYSVGNQLLALEQCSQRGIAPGPIATFNKWKERKRHVRKGEKAITLCQPVTIKRKADREGDQSEEVAFTRFIYRRNWFVLSMTEGEDYTPEPLPTWDRSRALATLGIEEIPFDHLNGNVWGFARGRQVAISPLSPQPDRTLLHELAHVVLGHTAESVEQDGPATRRSIREVEAEGVALILAEILGVEGAEYSRGYLQHWLKGETIAERNCQRIFACADRILKAGRDDQHIAEVA
jgi:antirestriction protein ArdC